MIINDDDALYDTNALLHIFILDVHTILTIHTMPFEDNLWWCSEIAEQRFFSNCGWQWAVCGNDFYRDDLTVIKVQRYQQQSLVCDRCTGSTIFFLSGCQDGARKGGHSLLPVEVEKLGSGSFLQVAACKSGGRGLLQLKLENWSLYNKGVVSSFQLFLENYF